MGHDDRPEGKPPQQASSGLTGPNVPKDLQSQLGHRLKAHYDTLLGEPIPDRFAELLGLLEGRELDAGLKTQKGRDR